MDDLGKRIKLIQVNSGLNLKEFAEKCGIVYRTLLGYIDNKNTKDKSRRTDLLIKIAQSFNVNIEWLLEGTGEMYKNIYPKSMPEGFISRLKQDLADKNDDFYKEISIPKARINNALNGMDTLTRVEVIELARKLNQPIESYVWLAGLEPEMFDVLLEKNSVKALLREANKMSDKDLDNLLDVMDTTLKVFLDKKLKEKEIKEKELQESKKTDK